MRKEQAEIVTFRHKALAAPSIVIMQKLCKFASSSLDYDDIDAAIKNLTESLDLLHKSK